MKIRMLSLLFLGLALQTMPALAQERLPTGEAEHDAVLYYSRPALVPHGK